MTLANLSLSRERGRIANLALLALALVLLWAQMWGQSHGIAHPQSLAAGLGSVQEQAHSDANAHAEQRVPAQHADFDHDAGDAQCRVLDQLSHADSLPCVPLLALPVGFSAALVAQSVGLATARWAAVFQARAPPFLR